MAVVVQHAAQRSAPCFLWLASTFAGNHKVQASTLLLGSDFNGEQQAGPEHNRGVVLRDSRLPATIFAGSRAPGRLLLHHMHLLQPKVMQVCMLRLQFAHQASYCQKLYNYHLGFKIRLSPSISQRHAPGVCRPVQGVCKVVTFAA
jgi:hypothetical protein